MAWFRALCARQRAVGCAQNVNFSKTLDRGAAPRRLQKYAKGPIHIDVVSRLARASVPDRVRANEDFRPRFRGSLSRSCRDLAICAVAALIAHEAAHRRPRKYAKGPIQVPVVSRFAPRTCVGATSGARETHISRRHWTAFASPCRDLAIRRGGGANEAYSQKLPKSEGTEGRERKR